MNNPLPESRIDAMLDFVDEFNAGFSPIEFVLTQGEVTRFTDMDTYRVIQR